MDINSLIGPRERAMWINTHELVPLDEFASWKCKHCKSVFTNERVSCHKESIEQCKGPIIK